MKILNYTVDIYKTDTPESIRVKKAREYKLNATKALIAAEMTLELNERMLEKAADDKRTEAEIKGITDAIEFERKSVLNWTTQLEVINNW